MAKHPRIRRVSARKTTIAKQKEKGGKNIQYSVHSDQVKVAHHLRLQRLQHFEPGKEKQDMSGRRYSPEFHQGARLSLRRKLTVPQNTAQTAPPCRPPPPPPWRIALPRNRSESAADGAPIRPDSRGRARAAAPPLPGKRNRFRNAWGVFRGIRERRTASDSGVMYSVSMPTKIGSCWAYLACSRRASLTYSLNIRCKSSGVMCFCSGRCSGLQRETQGDGWGQPPLPRGTGPVTGCGAYALTVQTRETSERSPIARPAAD